MIRIKETTGHYVVISGSIATPYNSIHGGHYSTHCVSCIKVWEMSTDMRCRIMIHTIAHFSIFNSNGIKIQHLQPCQYGLTSLFTQLSPFRGSPSETESITGLYTRDSDCNQETQKHWVMRNCAYNDPTLFCSLSFVLKLEIFCIEVCQCSTVMKLK